MTISEYIRQGIVDLFLEVAEMVNAGQIELSEDELAGVPLMLFKGQTAMLRAWDDFVEELLTDEQAT